MEATTAHASSKRSMRSRTLPSSIPYAACSFTCHPAPSPSTSRPPLITSMVAAAFAIVVGCRYVTLATRVPEADPRRPRRHGRQGRPALQDGAIGRAAVGGVGHEVVGQVGPVPAGGFAVLHETQHLVPRSEVARPDAEPHPATLPTRPILELVTSGGGHGPRGVIGSADPRTRDSSARTWNAWCHGSEPPSNGEGPKPPCRGLRALLVRPLGLEPRTCGLRVRCSAN